ncbi:MAG: hypothetical protein Q9220_002731 [cf. Caloplaca sp. 1 TL-2023]
MLPFKISFLLTAFVHSSSCLLSHIQKSLQETDRSPFTPDFDDRVAALLNEWHVPGLAIAVVDGNETYSKGYGISTFPSTPVTPSTLFYTGSTTKAFTSAALTLLIEDSANTINPITWRTPISSLIRSDFVLPSDYATLHTTLEDAASHRTGMPRHDASYGSPEVASVRDVVRNLRNLPLTEEPRVRMQYCNMMYIVLSHVIETLTGSWLGDVLRTRIWEPLNMTQTFFSLEDAQRAVSTSLSNNKYSAELARGYKYNNLTGTYIPLPHLNSPLISGAGNIISSVLDYTHWLRFLLLQSPPLLSAAGHKTLFHPRIILDSDSPLPGFTGPSAYSLGWNIEHYRGSLLISHDGGLPGFGAKIGFLPSKNWGVVMMANSAQTSNIVQNILFFHLLDNLLDIPDAERGDVAAVFTSVMETQRERLKHPVKALFPDLPATTIFLSLPLKEYTGTYYNPGYKNFTITLSPSPSPTTSTHDQEQQTLQVHYHRTWPGTLNLTHVSGEHFLVKGYENIPAEEEKDVDPLDPLSNVILKAEFRIGEDGQVAEVGADLEPEMRGEKIWFRRGVAVWGER